MSCPDPVLKTMVSAVTSPVNRQPSVSVPLGLPHPRGDSVPEGGGLQPTTDPCQVLRPVHLGSTQDNFAAITHTSKMKGPGRCHSSLLSLGVSKQRKMFQVHPSMVHNSSLFSIFSVQRLFHSCQLASVFAWNHNVKISLLAHICSVFVWKSGYTETRESSFRRWYSFTKVILAKTWEWSDVMGSKSEWFLVIHEKCCEERTSKLGKFWRGTLGWGLLWEMTLKLEAFF